MNATGWVQGSPPRDCLVLHLPESQLVWKRLDLPLLPSHGNAWLDRLCLTECISELVSENFPANRPLIVYHHQLKYQVDGFVGELTF